ncbi:MAG TPA: gamma-glutamylcyclotransferase family protein [Streptosporangiaceae bacterium]|nr:gamma-glutamylcyclotransferase family protein [Streptosporangiaceae bacterium]
MTRRRDRPPARWPESLFVYGTLLFADIVRALIGRVPDRTAASAAGWRAAALPGLAYPGLVRAPGATADGLLLTGLTPAEWQVIDAFENGGYDLAEVALVDGRSGWAYTWAADIAPLPEDWSAEEFAVRHLADYVARCAAWRRGHRAASDDG